MYIYVCVCTPGPSVLHVFRTRAQKHGISVYDIREGPKVALKVSIMSLMMYILHVYICWGRGIPGSAEAQATFSDPSQRTQECQA